MINSFEAIANLELVRGYEDSLRPGKGVTIGILDNGIDLDHDVFTSRPQNQERSLSNIMMEDGATQNDHGTAVAGIAGGDYGAYGANIKSYAIRLGDGSGEYEPVTLRQLNAIDYGGSELYSYILNDGVDILNLSFGFQGSIEDYSEQDLRNNISRTIRTLAQSEKDHNKTILVWAAGNAGEQPSPAQPSSPEILSGMVALIDELQGHSIAVVSVGENGRISDFSNRCGVASDFCIAAPGEEVLVASFDEDDNGYFSIASGTSFAAPLVTGGLAIMKHVFRDQLTNEQLVSRLFETANDVGPQGIYANSAVYGHGLMDLGAATNPRGIPAFMGASGAALPISSTSLTLGAPFGDGLANALASREVVAFDSLGAPFWFEAASFTGLSEGASLATRLNDFLHPAQLRSIPETWQFNLKENAMATEIGHLALANGASRLTIAGPQGVSAMLFQDPQELEGLTLAWTPRTFDAFTVEAGYLNEHQSLLGSHGEGAGGRFSGETLFLGAGLNVTAGNWQLAAQGEVGHVTPAVAHSQFIKEISSLSTSSFRLAASRPFANGSALHFSLSQPLRVESGSFTHNLVASGAHALSLDQAVSDPLAPQGRQLDLTARLDLPWLGGDLSLGATRSAQPRHQQSAAPEWTLFTGYRSTW